MSQLNTMVYAMYRNGTEAERAIASLRAAGFKSADVSVVFPSLSPAQEHIHEKSSMAPEGAAAGAGTGAVVGGVFGWLAGVGSIAIPGVGPLIAAGPIMGLFAGAGVGGAVGSIAGALIGLGIPEYEVEFYEGQVKKGAILVSVRTSNSEWTKSAEQILRQNGGEEIGTKSELVTSDSASETDSSSHISNY